MTACDEYIHHISSMLPDMATTRDLIRLGVFRSYQGAASARRTGQCPPFFKMNQRVYLYPKDGVIEFLTKSKANICL